MKPLNKKTTRAAYIIEGSLGDSLISLPSLRLFLKTYSNAETMLISLGPSVQLGAANLFQGRLPFTKFVHIRASSNESPLKRFLRWIKLAAIIRTNGIQECVYGIRSENLLSIKRANTHRRILKTTGCKVLASELNHKSLEASVNFPNRMHESIAREIFNRVAEAHCCHPSELPFEFHFPLNPEDESRAKQWLVENGITDKRCIAVCVGSKSSVRWSIDYHRSVLEGLVSKFDVVPILFGGADELSLAALACKNIPQYKAAFGLPIGTAASVLKHCEFYIGNDTGTMHLAASVGTKCVAVFSARAPKGQWYPLGENHIVFRTDIDCAGCFLQSCEVRKLECLDRIQPLDVLKACSELL